MSNDLIEAVARELHHAGWEQDYWTAAAKQVIAAIEASGYRVVPKEATDEMIKALNEYAVCAGYIPEGYVAMLAAAPKVTS